jgi:hypothetical protein
MYYPSFHEVGTFGQGRGIDLVDIVPRGELSSTGQSAVLKYKHPPLTVAKSLMFSGTQRPVVRPKVVVVGTQP